MALTLRSTKGSALTHVEMDANLSGLADGSNSTLAPVNWTPSLGGTATYTTQLGRAIKQGKLVHAWALLAVNTIGTGSTGLISGLPYTASATYGQAQAGAVGAFSNSATNYTFVSCYVNQNSTQIGISAIAGAGTSMTAPGVFFGNGASIYLQITYFTD